MVHKSQWKIDKNFGLGLFPRSGNIWYSSQGMEMNACFFSITDERNSTPLSSLKGPLTFQHRQYSIFLSCDLLDIKKLEKGCN